MPARPALFPGTLSGRRRRQWLHVEVRRLCKKAGVPAVSPHGLRGWMASSAVAAGELPEVVSRKIGHTSSKMTLDHYIRAGLAEEASEMARPYDDGARQSTTFTRPRLLAFRPPT